MSAQPLKVTVYPNLDYQTRADAAKAALTQNREINGWNPLNMFQLQLPSLSDRTLLLLMLLGMFIVLVGAYKTRGK